MPRARVAFRQTDLTRALRAARKLGLEITGYEIEPLTGKIVVTTGAKAPAPQETPEANLARWRASRARRA